MAAAAQGAGSSGGKAAAERAANDVFEANLDTVVAMGWANVEHYCLDNFRKVRSKSFRPRGWALPGGMVHRLTASASKESHKSLPSALLCSCMKGATGCSIVSVPPRVCRAQTD